MYVKQFSVIASIRDKCTYLLIILLLLNFISSNDASSCIFKKKIYVNGIQQQQLQVESWGADSIRIRLSPDTITQTPDYQALLPEKPIVNRKVCQQLNGNTFINGNIKFNISSDNTTWTIQRLSDGFILLQTQSIMFSTYQYPPSIYSPLSSLYNLSLNYVHNQDGYLYGLGEHRYADNVTLAYHNFYIPFVFSQTAPVNADITIPWYVHSSGFGFLWNLPGYGSFNVQDDKQITWTATSTHQLDIWITTTPKEASISSPFYNFLMKNFVDAVGRPNPLPKFASGFWQSKNRYRSQDELLAVAKGYHDRQIPVGIIVIDWFHWITVGDWSFNPKCWPNVSQMMDQLNSYGMKVMVSVWPNVADNSVNFPAMQTAGLLTHDANGTQITRGANVYIVDEFNPAARQFFWEQVRKNYYSYGIKVYWLDADEPEGSRPGLQWWNERHDEEVAMVWVREHHRTFYEGLKEQGEQDIIMLSRSAWIGSHRMGVTVWSGDVDSSFSELQKQIKVAQNVALSSIYWWTTDIGGYRNGVIGNDEFEELLLRWFQFGAFCPIFRLHGERQPPLPDNECGFGNGNNEVWIFKYSSQITNIIKLRESLRDYVEYHLNISHQNGTPILRPMFYDYSDMECYSAEDQYMFGTDYLVAPVYIYQATSRSVYLPKLPQQNGTWQHYYTKQTYAGGQRYNVNVTLNDFPLFVKTTTN